MGESGQQMEDLQPSAGIHSTVGRWGLKGLAPRKGTQSLVEAGRRHSHLRAQTVTYPQSLRYPIKHNGNMKQFLQVLLLLLPTLAVPATALMAQKQPLSIKVLALVNAARSDPKAFLQAHEAEITTRNPRFAKQLAASKPLEKAIWDPGLEAWCKAKLGKATLNVPYTGKNELCGQASGMKGLTGGFEALDVVLDFHTNLLDPNCKFLGICFDASGEYYWYTWGYRCDAVNETFSYTQPVDSSKVDFNRLNTAKNSKELSPYEKRMVIEVNFARAYPKVYAQVIGHYLHAKANDGGGLSHDDFIAGTELMEELEQSEPLAILQPMPCVYAAARAHGLDCARRGFLDHTGSNGSQPWDRILKQCPDLEQANENLVGGSASARESVIDLLIDGGISNRGHRYNMLKPDWRFLGVYHFVGKMEGVAGVHQWVQNFGN